MSISLNNYHPDRSKYLCYKLNGYWFRLNHKSWSEYTGIKEPTISYRLHTGNCTVGVALGFEPYPAAIRNGKRSSTLPKIIINKQPNIKTLRNSFLLGI